MLNIKILQDTRKKIISEIMYIDTLCRDHEHFANRSSGARRVLFLMEVQKLRKRQTMLRKRNAYQLFIQKSWEEV